MKSHEDNANAHAALLWKAYVEPKRLLSTVIHLRTSTGGERVCASCSWSLLVAELPTDVLRERETPWGDCDSYSGQPAPVRISDPVVTLSFVTRPPHESGQRTSFHTAESLSSGANVVRNTTFALTSTVRELCFNHWGFGGGGQAPHLREPLPLQNVQRTSYTT
eukprot:6472828-Amphidinium_carterae.1